MATTNHPIFRALYFYPFGSPMPGRVNEREEYRFGFNSAEKIDEYSGGGNTYDLGARMYSSRLGKMFSPDPREKEYPWQSTYAYYANSPIWLIDYKGEGGEEALEKIINLLPDDVGKSVQNTINTIKENAPDFDLSRLALGVEYAVGTETTSGVKGEANALSGKVMFLGGDDAFYVYEYFGGEIGAGGESSIGANVNAGGSFFVAYQHNPSGSHDTFDGTYSYVRGAVGETSGTLTLGFDVGVTGSASIARGETWTVFSIEGSASVGAGVSTVITGGATGGAGKVSFTERPAPKGVFETILSLPRLFNPLPISALQRK
ncbi:MAG: hypothetical protein LBR81_04205 [Prevotellaceae bacterium]|nr:hypothetical protein [Prevotellaceae bacterium]